MNNYEQSIERARIEFLKWDQENMIERCRLKASAAVLQINFLGQKFEIERSTGRVQNLSAKRDAGFDELFSIYDYLCRNEPLPCPTGHLVSASGLEHTGQASPDASKLHQRTALQLAQHTDALARAAQRLGLAPFPQGDIACWFPVFDTLAAVFQFREGDEEFPPSVRFLWDECTPSYLKFETVHYVMGAFLRRLSECMQEICKEM